MDDIYAIRRRNFERLLNSPPLSVLPKKKDVALALDMTPSMFSQVVHPDYRIGDDLARGIELLLKLQPGSMDWRDVPQNVRTDVGRMRDAMGLLHELAILTGRPGLNMDPRAICIAYDFLFEFGGPMDSGNVLEMTKQLAVRLRAADAPGELIA